MVADRKSSGERGVAFLEASITIYLFLSIVFVGLWFSILAYRHVSLQYAVAAGARWAILGKKIEYPVSSGTYLSRERSIEYVIRQSIANPFGLNFGSNFTPGVDQPNIHICPATTPGCTTDDAGTPQSFIEISAVQPIQFFFWTINLSASAITRNEPFSS